MEWLEGSIVGVRPGKQAKKGKGGKVMLEDLANLSETRKPTLALRYLDIVLGDPDLRAEFLPKSDKIYTLLSTSLNVLDLFATGVDISEANIDEAQLRLLALGLEAVAKVEIHRRAADIAVREIFSSLFLIPTMTVIIIILANRRELFWRP